MKKVLTDIKLEAITSSRQSYCCGNHDNHESDWYEYSKLRDLERKIISIEYMDKF